MFIQHMKTPVIEPVPLHVQNTISTQFASRMPTGSDLQGDSSRSDKHGGCYILPPSLNFRPDATADEISLGNLLVDPFSPHRPLARLPASLCPNIDASTETNVSISRNNSVGGALSGGVEFAPTLSRLLFQLGGVHASGELSRSQSKRFIASSVRTQVFDKHPDIADIEALIRETPRAQRVLEDWIGAGRLFLIVGRKIAKGLTVAERSAVKRGVGVSLQIGTTVLAAATGGMAPVSPNAGVSGFANQGESSSVTVDGEVVLAYSLLRITTKGFLGRRRVTSFEEYRNSNVERLLGDGDDEVEGEGDNEVMVGDVDEAVMMEEAELAADTDSEFGWYTY
ncbi:hypothetical protein QBC35DRAFT_507957 [Podospora australis]|uniref:Uncharacterized protein n=1 Tax=Podospora australis TaxID=1536484 RepID=A0AAN7ACF8_9PEZI|nr:hypothetical protein QBC35DRAFT_507957 [Podospora australis]